MKRGRAWSGSDTNGFCVLKTRTLENYSLGFALHFKLQECNAMRIQIIRYARSRKPRSRYLRLCCDACNVPVVQSDQFPQGCLGRTGTPPVSFPFEGQSQARKHGNVVSAGTARFHCFTVYTYSIIFVVFHCFVKFTYKEKKNTMMIKWWWSTFDFWV